MRAKSAEILKRRCQCQNSLELTLARSGTAADENRMHFLLTDCVQGPARRRSRGPGAMDYRDPVSCARASAAPAASARTF